jgi:hypothetical protein
VCVAPTLTRTKSWLSQTYDELGTKTVPGVFAPTPVCPSVLRPKQWGWWRLCADAVGEAVGSGVVETVPLDVALSDEVELPVGVEDTEAELVVVPELVAERVAVSLAIL